MCPDVRRFNHFWTNLALVPHDPVTRFHGPVEGRGHVLLTCGLVAVLQDFRPQIFCFSCLRSVMPSIRPVALTSYRYYRNEAFISAEGGGALSWKN